ncbi:hypothetical protein EDD17DRAFT_1524385 [Pisolithus thermaeus]|nr:hypothetical protein EDD17DRAFT_1524385 [Pisolithus thermaeus]
MYKAEILGKLPVIKQFLFRPILPYEGPPPHKQVASAHAENIPTKDGGTVKYERECNEEMIQKLLKEAREEIENLVTSVKRKVGFDEKYEQTLRGDF